MKPNVSVVIPTWNRCDLVLACLSSLAEQTYSNLETLVVDDGSSDDTAEMVQRLFPQARVIVLSSNRGFAAAVNAGIREARGTWVFLLNNDVTLAPDCLEQLVTSAENAKVAMAAPVIFWRDTPGILYSAGDRIRANGRPESNGFRRPRNEYALPKQIFGVGAAAGLYRRDLFDTVGLLDETFTAYFEDSDFCFRARLAGFQAVLATNATAWHIGSATISGRTWWRSMLCFRNHGLLVLKNMPALLLIRYLPKILAERVHQARMLVSSARTEFGLVRAWWLLITTVAALIRRIPGALRARHSIQRTRKLSLAELRQWMEEDTQP